MPKSLKALVIVPANNTTMQPEIAALCPEIGEILVARVQLPRSLTRENFAGYGAATVAAADPFVAAKPDVVIHAAASYTS